MKYEIRFSETFPGCTVPFFKGAVTVAESEVRSVTGFPVHAGNVCRSGFPEGSGRPDTILYPPGFYTKTIHP